MQILNLIDIDRDGCSSSKSLSLRANVEEGAEVGPGAELSYHAGTNDVGRRWRATSIETRLDTLRLIPSFGVRYKSVFDGKT